MGEYGGYGGYGWVDGGMGVCCGGDMASMAVMGMVFPVCGGGGWRGR